MTDRENFVKDLHKGIDGQRNFLRAMLLQGSKPWTDDHKKLIFDYAKQLHEWESALAVIERMFE